MHRIVILIFLTCACISLQAQVNYVKNPDFEEYTFCPTNYDDVHAARYWNAVDTTFIHLDCRPDYCNTCAITGVTPISVPSGSYFYQYPRSGNGMVQVQMFTDEMPSPPPPYYLYRDYLQGHLFKPLQAGVSYCVKFYVNLEEASAYAINHIGAYLDDNSIDTVEYCSKPMTFITPQVFTSTIITDTFNWIKIEGSFIANGTEDHITIGNFFDKSHTLYVPTPNTPGGQWSWYLVDDVSVIETNLQANAGIDKAVHIGDSVFIGRGLDSTKGLDCKWYKKGALVDSGAGLWAKGITNGIDTYVVVQTICGLIKTDTVQVFTFPVGIDELPETHRSYDIFPNPSNGEITIIQRFGNSNPVKIAIYDAKGSAIFMTDNYFSDHKIPIILTDTPPGLYIIQITEQSGNIFRYRFSIIN